MNTTLTHALELIATSEMSASYQLATVVTDKHINCEILAVAVLRGGPEAPLRELWPLVPPHPPMKLVAR